MYKAAWLCEGCGEFTRKELTEQGKAPVNADDEHTYDSDNFPKGPYDDGGGESDYPEHCDQCGCFLENSLTNDGLEFAKETILRHKQSERGVSSIIAIWANFYGLDWSTPISK